MIEISKNLQQGHRQVTSEVILPIEAGKLTALIGPNGAGKTRFMTMMNRLLKEDVGEIYLDHSEVRAWKSNKLARKLALLKENKGASLKLTTRDLVSYGRLPYCKIWFTDEDEKLIDQAMAALDLTELADTRIHLLSGGQLQRVYIAMLLAQNSEYILLDEPLNNLDIAQSKHLMETLQKLVRDFGKTIVLVLQDINVAATYVENIVAIKAGQIHASGTAAEIIQPEVLAGLYGMEIKVCELAGKRFCIY
ncbi:ATP-binding cassette domain-containing protein [Enterococcus sp. LJL120]